MHPAAVPVKEVQIRPRYHNRCRIRFQNHQCEGQANQAADMGHRTLILTQAGQ